MVRLVKTVEEAVGILLLDLSSEGLEELKRLTGDQLIDEHLGLGMYVRNRFALWNNQELAKNACGDDYPTNADDASMAILKELWKRLHEQVRSGLQ